MRKLRAAFGALLPSFLGAMYWRLFGATLGPKARIRFGSWIDVATLSLGPGATIGPLTFVQAKSLTLGANASLKPLSFSRSHLLHFGAHARNSPTCIVMGTMHPRSHLVVGDHSRIFPFCWLEPGEGIHIGKQVGIGGHTFVFTHGSWADYLRGGPVKFGGVRIEDDVWLPWRVTVLAGATIGAGSIVMAGSVVSRSVPAQVIAGGSPAKVLKERGADDASETERLARAKEIVARFSDYLRDGDCKGLRAEEDGLTLYRGKAALTLRSPHECPNPLETGSLWFSVLRSPSEAERTEQIARGISVVDYPALRHDGAKRTAFPEFVDFLTQYGVRLYEGDAAAGELVAFPAPSQPELVT